MRAFIAIELEPALRRPLLKLLRDFPRADGVRWATEHQLHLTLKFLGDVSDMQLPKVCDAVAAACAKVEPFSISIKGLGVFPAPRNPRVLWCGVEDPTDGCRRWVEAVDPLLSELNFKPETRAYTPHITLGRSRSTAGGDVLREMLETAPAPDTDQMEVGQVVVFESVLLPTGARYRVLATTALGAG